MNPSTVESLAVFAGGVAAMLFGLASYDGVKAWLLGRESTISHGMWLLGGRYAWLPWAATVGAVLFVVGLAVHFWRTKPPPSSDS